MYPKQFEKVAALPAPERAEYAFKRFADWEELWALYRDGWALSALDDGRVTFPVWPEQEFAAAFAAEEWAGYEARAIAIDEFVDEFLPDFDNRGMLVGVFPAPAVGSIAVTPVQFRDLLQQELDRF